MKNFKQLFISITLLIFMGALSMNNAFAYSNEVYESGGQYYWKTNDAVQGSSSDLSTAIQNAIGSGNREVHILTGGTLYSQINLEPGLTLYCHDNTFNKDHGGYGFHQEGAGNIAIYDMTLNNNTNMGIRTSRASDIYIENVAIYGGSIGIRIDSHPSRPYEDGRWVSNVHIQDCRFEDGSGHGLETYGVDGFLGFGLVARNMGGCGVLLNKTTNGTIGTVDAYRCDYGGGYAGLRFANDCSDVTVDMLYANECGRGFFVLTGSNNIQLNNCEITNTTDIGIWLEDVANCSVEAGCCNSGVAVSGSGSYANVSSSCDDSGGSGNIYQLRNRGTGLYLDGMGLTENGEAAAQYANTSHVNAQWEMVSTDGYTQLRNVGTGLFLDGMGRTENGADCGQWANTTHANSQWSIENYDGNYVRIQNRGTGLFLDGMGRTENGAAAGQWANTTHSNAQWELIEISNKSASKQIANPEESSDINPEEDVVLYPNPVSSYLSIAINKDYEEAEVRVFDTAGKMVENKVISGEKYDLNLDNLKQGIYLITIISEDWIMNRKIVKQ